MIRFRGLKLSGALPLLSLVVRRLARYSGTRISRMNPVTDAL